MRQFSTPQRQQGFAAVFAAIAMIAMLSAVALAIDIGRLYTAQRDLQKLANLSALDAVRVASGCSVETGGQPGGQAQASAEARASLARNAQASLLEELVVTTEVGRRQPLSQSGDTQAFEVLPDPSPLRDAVRVRLSRPGPTRIIPGITGDSSQRLVATAVAAQPAKGKIAIGSDTLVLDGGLLNSVVGGLLCAAGDSVCQANVIALNVAGSAGLLGASVTLEELATALNLTVQDLSNPLVLQAESPLLPDVIEGLAGSLSGSASASVTGLLTALGDAAQGNPEGVPLAALLQPVTEVAGDVPFVGLLDLLIGLGQSAKAEVSGGAPIRLSLANVVNIPNVTAAHAFLRVTEGPELSDFGPAGATSASTAALTLQLRLEVGLLSSTTSLLSSLLLGLATVESDPIRLGVDVEVAKAEAFLDSLQCPRRGINDGLPIAGLSVDTAAAEVQIGTYAGSGATAPPITQTPASLVAVRIRTLLNLVGATINVGLSAPVATTVGGGSQTLDEVVRFQPLDTVLSRIYVADGAPGAPADAGNPQSVGSSNNLGTAFSSLFGSLASGLNTSSGGNSQICVVLLCVPVSGLVDPLLSGVSEVLGLVLTGVGGLADGLVDPLLNALGVQVGGATVTLMAVEMPQPAMVTTELADSGN